MAETDNGPMQAFAIGWACEECGGQMSRREGREGSLVLTSSQPLFPHWCASGHTANLRDSYPKAVFRPVQPEGA